MPSLTQRARTRTLRPDSTESGAEGVGKGCSSRQNWLRSSVSHLQHLSIGILKVFTVTQAAYAEYVWAHHGMSYKTYRNCLEKRIT